MFSLNRIYAESILVQGSTYTFWGKGVSQGHSDAIRRVEGVKNGIQYTVPIEAAVEEVRSGSEPELTTRQKHLRECYVVAEEGADKAQIEGETGREGNKHVIEYSLKLDSNPEFTSSVLVAYARAAYRLSANGECGAKTVFDIAPALLSQKTPEQLRKEIL